MNREQVYQRVVELIQDEKVRISMFNLSRLWLIILLQILLKLWNLC